MYVKATTTYLIFLNMLISKIILEYKYKPPSNSLIAQCLGC